MYEIRGRELADFCSTVPIILGDNYENLDNKWSNRIYNILGAGGFLITPNVEGLEEEFEEGKHFIGYKPGNLSELKDKINLFLTKPKERKKIARAGYKHVWKNYTYLKRCKILLETIKGDSAQFTQHK